MVSMLINLSLPEMLGAVTDLNFDGVGLFRLEFLTAVKVGKHPLALFEEERGRDIYVDVIASNVLKIASSIYPKPLVVRFTDFKSNEYSLLEGSERFEPKEPNPALGLRGISRYVLSEFREWFIAECVALRKVCDQLDNVCIMLPFVRTTWEVRKCLDMMQNVCLVGDPSIPLWLMVEVPSVALNIERFNVLPIDGYSIGTNDLNQLLLGIDRDHPLMEQAKYLTPDEPTISKVIRIIIEGAKKGNKTVSICGEWPSIHPEIVPQLVEWGIDSISVNPNVLEKIRELIQK